jgi:hypothetical protein
MKIRFLLFTTFIILLFSCQEETIDTNNRMSFKDVELSNINDSNTKESTESKQGEIIDDYDNTSTKNNKEKITISKENSTDLSLIYINKHLKISIPPEKENLIMTDIEVALDFNNNSLTNCSSSESISQIVISPSGLKDLSLDSASEYFYLICYNPGSALALNEEILASG